MKQNSEINPNPYRRVSHQAITKLVWFAAILFVITIFSSIAPAATFHVTTTTDNGSNTNPTAGSLREAIIKANLASGTDTIDFNITGSGVHIFSLITALPVITDPVVIDGYTQPGSKANTLPNNDDAILLIEITGTNPFNFSVDDGLVITAGSSTVKGLIINGFKGTGNTMGAGIRLTTKGSNVIAGNFIGVDPNGTNQIPNGDGILIVGCDNNVIGGSQTFSRNLISGNKLGIDIQQTGAYNNLIVGNFIGVNRSATGALGNTGSGIQLNNVGTASSAGVIGGANAGAGNVISGNGSQGIQVSGSCSNLKIQGNLIGTNVTGTAAISNAASGIRVDSTNSAPVQIGGPTVGNIVSGNHEEGIELSGGDGVLVDGNYIGTDITGKLALGNKEDGLVIASNSHTIGGSTPADGNVIAANGSAGIYITGGSQASFFNRNLIGVGVDKVTPLGNAIDGIRLDNGSNNFFGDPSEPNMIAFNGGTGIWIRKGTGNLLSSNSFTGNHSLGIDLAADGNSTGVDQNDPGDADTGANNMQNFPVLTHVSIIPNGLTFVSGGLNSTANTKFHIELFANTAADNSGFGEGQTYIGGFDATTDANGNASFTTGGWPNLTAGQFISATATDPNRNTSEFSKCAVIVVDAPGSLEFTAAAFTVTENGGQATVTVNRTGGSFGAVTLQYATVAGGSATAGTDYTSVSGTLNWGDGDVAVKSFTIPIKDNAVKAPNKTVNLAVSSPTNGATLGSPANAVLTIVDDETFQPGTLAFTASAYSVNEGAGQATISVSRTGGNSGAVSVNFSTADGTANVIADYGEVIGTLSWADGDTATKTFVVPIVNDSVDEADETVLLTLSKPGGGATIGSAGSAVLTIVDDDLPPKVSINDVSIAEGNSGTTDFTFTVTLAAASSQTVSVNYTTADNTAQAGSDYQAANAMLTFVPGETSKQFTVVVNGDTQVEANETFVVNLYNLINASVGKVTGVGTIVNDDSNSSSPTIEFSQGNYSVQEDLGAFNLTVTRSGDTSGASTVDYQTVDGVAIQKSDFEYTAGTLTFAPGESSKTVQLLLNEDMFVEGNEDFSVTLTNPTGGTLGSQAAATITIIDDVPESATSPIDDAQSFVYMHYHDFLNREPDATGLAFWTNQITACGTNTSCIDAARTNVSAAFYLSTEFQETGYLLYLMQKESYAAAPKYAAFMRDLQEISRGVIVNAPGWQQTLAGNQQQFADKWVNRPEFIAAYNGKSNSEFVSALYTNAGIAATPADKAALVTKLDSANETRSAALLEVASNAAFRNQEMNRAFVLMEYFGYLRRDPSDVPDADLSGYNFWLNKLNQFGGNYLDAEMVRAFIISTEYRQRFSN